VELWAGFPKWEFSGGRGPGPKGCGAPHNQPPLPAPGCGAPEVPPIMTDNLRWSQDKSTDFSGLVILLPKQLRNT